MDRRGFLVRLAGGGASVGVVVGGSGCAERIGADTAVSERDRPERPDPLTQSSVVEYVAAVEEVRTHNVHARNGATSVELSTTATLDYELEDGYHVTAQHAGTVSHGQGGEHAVGEVYSRPVPYRVTDEETIRLSVDREEVDMDSRVEGEAARHDGDGEEPVDEPLGIRICNALDRHREIDVRVTRQPDDEETDQRRLGTTRTIGARTAVELRAISFTPGSYRVVAQVSENGVTGEGRIDVDLPGVERGPNVDVLSAPDELSTRELPPFDPI